MTCYPCSQGRSEDCKHLGLCPTWCCPPDPFEVTAKDIADLDEDNE